MNPWLHVYSLFNYVEDEAAHKRGTDYVDDGLSKGPLRPLIEKVYPLESYIEAWRYLSQPRAQHGKVMIETGA